MPGQQISVDALLDQLEELKRENAGLKDYIDVVKDRERASYEAWERDTKQIGTFVSALMSFVNFAHSTAPHNRSGEMWNIWLDFLEGLALGTSTAVSSPLRGSEREGPGEPAQGA